VPGQNKSLAISVDETDGATMTLQEFRDPVHRLLAGNKFDAMDLKTLCLESIDLIKNKVVVYEKHTKDCASYGLSIYLSNFLIP
jgi:hypothetical protein